VKVKVPGPIRPLEPRAKVLVTVPSAELEELVLSEPMPGKLTEESEASLEPNPKIPAELLLARPFALKLKVEGTLTVNVPLTLANPDEGNVPEEPVVDRLPVR
jgi:hypothetical protein